MNGVRDKKSGGRDATRITRGAGSNTFSIVAFLQETVNTTNRELQAGLGGTRLGFARAVTRSLATGLSRFSTFARHFELIGWLSKVFCVKGEVVG